jgi:hypothetical protein
MRLLGIDGAQFLLRNTAPILAHTTKARSLLLGDRFYGVGCCIAECIPLCRERGSEFLFRVRANLKADTVRTFADGSARVPTLRVSFGKTLRMVQMLRPVLEASAGLLSWRQQGELIRRLEERLLRQLTGPRRERTYPRAVRQPVKKWPRLQHNRYQQGSTEIKVMRIK